MAESQDHSEPLRFEILGPLRVLRGDREVPLGPSKQRAVLAVLLVNANRPVLTSRVVDAVWEDDPPQNGPNVVQKYVAGLRRLLEPDRSPRTPGRMLTLTDAGYLLRVAPGHLDLDRFGERVRQARSLRAVGKLTEAATAFRLALALWRGEALSGLTGTLFDTTRDRLQENRVAALSEWAEVELELGRHSQLVPELVRLVTDFPLREELRYLLMLALYRSGRQAEALAAYRDARQFLNDEFGIEPGERLQTLHQRILRGDPALSGPTSPDQDSGTPPVAHVPGPVTDPPVPSVWSLPAPSPGTAGVTSPSQRPATWGMWLARVVGVLVPVVSFGVFTWAVVAYLAGRRNSWRLGLAAAGYFVLLGVMCSAIPAIDAEGEAFRTADAVLVFAMFLSMVGGAVHVAVLDPGRPD